jgi:tRNA (mo5U34)-methyltransferase
VNNEEIKQTIASFPRWHYQFNLRGNLTLRPPVDKGRILRHKERKKYFFDPLVQLLGGSLVGKRVMDLGCNAGFWSLCAVESGCDFVLGIDGRQMHIDQANFVFRVNQVAKSKYDFIEGNIFNLDLRQFGAFDVVLCLGLMYHINKHVNLLESIDYINNDILVIDTDLHQLPGSYLKLQHEPLSDPRNAVAHELVMAPTRQAVSDLVQEFGYSVVTLKPRFHTYTGSRDYQLRARRAFLCAKQTDLTRLPAEEVEPTNLPTQLVDTSALIVHRLVRLLIS